MSATALEAFRYRLSGSKNRIMWRAADHERIAKRVGLVGRSAPQVVPERLPSGLVRAPSFRAAPDPTRQYTFTVSTASVDRMGDSLKVSGWQLANYRANPIWLWAHDSTSIPVGRAVKIWTEGGRLKSTVQLAPADANPAAENLRQLLEGGFLFATSVGFLPIAYEFSNDPARKYGIDFSRMDLAEISIVPVPANPDCTIDPAQSGSQQTPKQASEPNAKAAARRIREREIAALKAKG
jgi:HK97 family phage prohead protease